MDHILAKVKGRSKTKIFKLLSESGLFTNIEIDLKSCIEYDPDHNLDEDSWFKIERFSQESYCIELLRTKFDSKDYNNLPKDKFCDIVYLCSLQGNNYYFQKITPSLFVNKKMISYGEVARLEPSDNRLVVNSQPDAVYFKSEDTLIFRNLATISSIFKGIDILYKTATEEEVQTFLEEPFICTSEQFGEKSVSKPNRKRIALAMNTLSSMSEKDRNNIIDYIGDYCNGKLQIDPNNKIVEISTDEELKLLLYGIEQRFYTTPFGGERRLANSVQKL